MTIKARWGNISSKGGGRKILNIKLSGDTGAHIPVELNGVKCLALIDTGASRSCMSSAQYKLIGAPPLEPLPPGARLRSCNRDFHGSMGVDQLPSLYRAQDVCPIVHSM